MVDLKKAREAKGMLQRELADLVGLRRQTISHMERGRITPSVKSAKAIARVLDLNWVEFFT